MDLRDYYDEHWTHVPEGQVDYSRLQYVVDALEPGERVLDSGCGHGRNLVYLLRQGFDVYGTDASDSAIAAVQQLASRLRSSLPPDHFRLEPVERMSFPDAAFDVVLSSAVMHFARDEHHWRAMLDEMFRVLKPGGLFFARLATTIGHETRVRHVEGRRYIMPDGDERFLVDEDFIMRATHAVGGALVDPLKTSVVQNARSMMTWVVQKGVSSQA